MTRWNAGARRPPGARVLTCRPYVIDFYPPGTTFDPLDIITSVHPVGLCALDDLRLWIRELCC